jgi:hypothetical protein
MSLKDYQEGLDRAAEKAQIIDQYIDEHELLRDADAFGSSFDRNQDALIEIWRILQTRRKGEEDIAIADIKSTMDHLILAAATRYADNIMRQREDYVLGAPV